jgi:hypothetical protein
MPRVGFKPRSYSKTAWPVTTGLILNAYTSVRTHSKLYSATIVHHFLEFEVVTAVAMKSYVFCDIAPCSPLKVNRRFGGTFRFHLQGRRISWVRNQPESMWQAEPRSRWFLAQIIIRPWIWRRYLPPKRRLTFNGLHGIISQMIALFKQLSVYLSRRSLCWKPLRSGLVSWIAVANTCCSLTRYPNCFWSWN